MHRTRIALLAFLLAIPGFAQTKAATPVPAPAAPTAAPDEETVNRTRRQLMDLLRMSPRLMEVLSRDPSLLTDAEYIQRTNPELVKFLQLHPEVVRNPEFYLFGGRGGDRRWEPGFNSVTETERERVTNRLVNDLGPIIAILVFLFTGAWLVRLVMDNLRWKRVVRLQTDVHNKLLDKFGNSQELLAYMQTDAGKRFLEGAPISVSIGSDEPQWGSPIVRIMRPLQVGIVLAAAGVGFMLNAYDALQTLGKIMLMIGFGFIISAAASWLIARQAGLLATATTHDASNRAL